MASHEHEVLVSIIREHPRILLELLGPNADTDEQRTIELDDRSENLTQMRAPDRHADAVLALRTTTDAKRPRAAFVVEVQLSRDSRKRWSWPSYVASARGRLRCPVTLVVLTTDAATARWCARPIVLDQGPSMLCPLVIGPGAVPVVVGDTARKNPDLAVLSLLAHRDEAAAVETGRALLIACRDDIVDGDKARQYADTVLCYLNEAARRALEAEMNLENYQLRSEFMRNFEAQATERGLEQGREEGREEGRLVALRSGVLAVLSQRGLAVTKAQQKRIADCTDAELLARWLERAVTAATTREALKG